MVRCFDAWCIYRLNPYASLCVRVCMCCMSRQNDYVLLSLVRTKHIGHIRDVRRLVVAVSRARLGLYVFCRQVSWEGGGLQFHTHTRHSALDRSLFSVKVYAEIDVLIETLPSTCALTWICMCPRLISSIVAQRLFENCYELTPTFNRLLSRPPVLELALGERCVDTRHDIFHAFVWSILWW